MIAHPLLATRPTESKPPPPLPADPKLPHLREALDGHRVVKWLRPLLHTNRLEARPRYIRYKPGNKATVLYDIRLGGLWTFAILTVARRDLRRLLAHPENVDLVRRARGRTPTSDPAMLLDRANVLVEWYPLNRALPGLLIDPAELASALPMGGPVSTPPPPELLVYKPERRAVLKWGDWILKVYARDDDLAQAVEGLTMSAGIAGIRAPNPAAELSALRITAQELIDGSALSDDAVSRSLLGEAMRECTQHPSCRPEFSPPMTI